MISVNEYFNGKVKSLGFVSNNGKATVGVMEKGDYEFGTNTVEEMIVISGKLSVKLPGREKFEEFGEGKKFIVAKDVKFLVKAMEDTSYICYYK